LFVVVVMGSREKVGRAGPFYAIVIDLRFEGMMDERS
jgi:hypothetical protein